MQSKDGVNWSELRSPSSGMNTEMRAFLGNYHFSRRSNPVWYTNDFVNFDAVDSFNISRPNNKILLRVFISLGEKETFIMLIRIGVKSITQTI